MMLAHACKIVLGAQIAEELPHYGMRSFLIKKNAVRRSCGGIRIASLIDESICRKNLHLLWDRVPASNPFRLVAIRGNDLISNSQFFVQYCYSLL